MMKSGEGQGIVLVFHEQSGLSMARQCNRAILWDTHQIPADTPI